MTYQVLARKWRPKRFEQIVGQDHIIKALKNSINHNRVAHAYLLTGTRGVGKTSIARIFAKALNCTNLSGDGEPCLQCQSCLSIEDGSSLDYVEMDGASHNGVEHIRQLVDNVQYLPVGGNKKVYVIDEVHMLSASAFNALLKTLEEPPAHVVFIFATTDPQKLLDTVISRCQRFDLRSVSLDQLIEVVKNISASEGISFENDSLMQQIAKLGRGSIRDTLSLLEQVVSLSVDKKISESDVTLALGLVRGSAVDSMIAAMLEGESVKFSQVFTSCMEENADLEMLCQQLLEVFYHMILDSSATEYGRDELIWIYETLNKDFSWSLSSMDPEKTTEIVFQKICTRREYFEPAQVATTSTQKKTVIEKKLTPSEYWDQFTNNFKEQYPASAANLEHGNLSGDFVYHKGQNLTLELAFSGKDSVFYDYFQEKEPYQKLLQCLAEHFEVDRSAVKLEMKLLSESEKEEMNFQSRAELEDLSREKDRMRKMDNIKTCDTIVSAEKIFNAKIDKIMLNKDEQ